MEWETLRNEEKVEESASTDISCSCVRPSSRFKQYFNPWYIWYQYMSCLCKFLYMCCQLFMLSPDLTRNRSNELREKRTRMPTKRLRVKVLMEMRHVMACCFFLSFLSFFCFRKVTVKVSFCFRVFRFSEGFEGLWGSRKISQEFSRVFEWFGFPNITTSFNPSLWVGHIWEVCCSSKWQVHRFFFEGAQACWMFQQGKCWHGAKCRCSAATHRKWELCVHLQIACALQVFFQRWLTPLKLGGLPYMFKSLES